jgi:hypothetical protein
MAKRIAIGGASDERGLYPDPAWNAAPTEAV